MKPPSSRLSAGVSPYEENQKNLPEWANSRVYGNWSCPIYNRFVFIVVSIVVPTAEAHFHNGEFSCPLVSAVDKAVVRYGHDSISNHFSATQRTGKIPNTSLCYKSMATVLRTCFALSCQVLKFFTTL